MKLTRQEINRKLLHLIALTLPVTIYYLPLVSGLSLWVSPLFMSILLASAVFMEKLRLSNSHFLVIFQKAFSGFLRAQEKAQTTGATHIIGGAFICSLIFVYAPYISFVVLTLFILGDAAAALVGLGIGRIFILKKTLEGSLACFALCLVLLTGIFPHLPFLSADLENTFSFSLVVITSLAITLLELFPLKISGGFFLNDNLYVPPVTGLVIVVFTVFFH